MDGIIMNHNPPKTTKNNPHTTTTTTTAAAHHQTLLSSKVQPPNTLHLNLPTNHFNAAHMIGGGNGGQSSIQVSPHDASACSSATTCTTTHSPLGATTSNSSCTMPPGWEMGYDQERQQPFYIDHNTKSTQWEPPSSFNQNTTGIVAAVPINSFNPHYHKYHHSTMSLPTPSSTSSSSTSDIVKAEILQIRQRVEILERERILEKELLQTKTELEQVTEAMSQLSNKLAHTKLSSSPRPASFKPNNSSSTHLPLLPHSASSTSSTTSSSNGKTAAVVAAATSTLPIHLQKHTEVVETDDEEEKTNKTTHEPGNDVREKDFKYIVRETEESIEKGKLNKKKSKSRRKHKRKTVIRTTNKKLFGIIPYTTKREEEQEHIGSTSGSTSSSNQASPRGNGAIVISNTLEINRKNTVSDIQQEQLRRKKSELQEKIEKLEYEVDTSTKILIKSRSVPNRYLPNAPNVPLYFSTGNFQNFNSQTNLITRSQTFNTTQGQHGPKPTMIQQQIQRGGGGQLQTCQVPPVSIHPIRSPQQLLRRGTMPAVSSNSTPLQPPMLPTSQANIRLTTGLYYHPNQYSSAVHPQNHHHQQHHPHHYNNQNHHNHHQPQEKSLSIDTLYPVHFSSSAQTQGLINQAQSTSYLHKLHPNTTTTTTTIQQHYSKHHPGAGQPKQPTATTAQKPHPQQLTPVGPPPPAPQGYVYIDPLRHQHIHKPSPTSNSINPVQAYITSNTITTNTTIPTTNSTNNLPVQVVQPAAPQPSTTTIPSPHHLAITNNFHNCNNNNNAATQISYGHSRKNHPYSHINSGGSSGCSSSNSSSTNKIVFNQNSL